MMLPMASSLFATRREFVEFAFLRDIGVALDNPLRHHADQLGRQRGPSAEQLAGLTDQRVEHRVGSLSGWSA
jgi:hypothetical protein